MSARAELSTQTGADSDRVDVEIARQSGDRTTSPTEFGVFNNGDSMSVELYGKNIRRAFSYEVMKSASSSATSTRLQPLQEWEGYVVEILESSFTADLADVDDGRGVITGSAEFDLEELSEESLKMLAVGAVFRWVVGYVDSNGPRKRVSQIVFRRLPAWTKSEVEMNHSCSIESLDWS